MWPILFPALFASLTSLQSLSPPFTDAHGDPLPPGAVARIGTVRLRHCGISDLAFSADGSRIISASSAATAVWDAQSGRRLSWWPRDEFCRGMALSADGSIVARAPEKESPWDPMEVHETASDKLRCKIVVADALEGDKPPVYGLALSKDQRWLASVNWYGDICLFTLPDGKVAPQWQHKPVREPRGGDRSAFTPDSKKLIHMTQWGDIHVYDVATGKEFVRIRLRGRLDALAVSPDGEQCAVYDGDNDMIRLLNLATGAQAAEIPHTRGAGGLTFSPDGKHLAWGGETREICLWNLKKRAITQKLPGNPRHDIRAIAFSPDGKTVACAAGVFAIHVFDLASGKERFPCEFGPERIDNVHFLADGKTLVSRCNYRARVSGLPERPRLVFWDLQGKPLKQVELVHPDVYDYAVSADARLAAFTEYERAIRVRDLASGKDILTFPRLERYAAFWFSPDHEYLLIRGPRHSGGESIRIGTQVWKRTSPTELKKIADFTTREAVHLFAPDSRWLGVGNIGGWDFYDLPSGRLRRSYPKLYGWGNVASPSGRVFVFTWRAPVLLELATGNQLCVLECDEEKGSTFSSTSFAFSPDGRIVAGCPYSDHVIFLWDAFTGKKLGELRGHAAFVSGLCFSPNGSRLVSGSWDTTMIVWDYRKMLAKAPAERTPFTPKRLQELWLDLHSADAERGYRAAAALAQSPDQTVPFLRKMIPPATADEQRRIRGWIVDLGNASYQARQRGETELKKLGELAEPLLRSALDQQPPLETKRRLEAILEKLPTDSPTPAWLANLRALDTLERIDTAEARLLLDDLSNGAPESLLTQEAKYGLGRLKKRSLIELSG